MTGRSTSGRAAVVPVVLAALVVLSCFSDRPDALAPPVSGDECSIPGGAVGPGQAVVLIRGFTFLPDTLRIRPGTTVTWVNCEAANVEAHTSTGGDSWDSGLIAPGDSYARTFSAPGSFGYFCRPHPGMTGAIIVE